MKFIVSVRQVFKKEFHVEAESLEKAELHVKSQLKSGCMQVSPEDIESTSLYGYQDDCIEEGEDLIESCVCLGSTVSLMDKFEMRNPDNTKKYRRLILTDFMVINYPEGKRSWIKINLIIERLKYSDKSEGDVTMSELKGVKKYEVRKCIKKFLASECGNDFPEKKEIKFKVPYQLRAQTSSDRMPGGWEYGTKYGDTHRYGIVGVILVQ